MIIPTWNFTFWPNGCIAAITCPKCKVDLECGHDWGFKMPDNDPPMNEKFPARKKQDGQTVYYWRSSYSGAFDKHFIIRADIFQKLSMYDRRSSAKLDKEYASADEAIKDLEAALAATLNETQPASI